MAQSDSENVGATGTIDGLGQELRVNSGTNIISPRSNGSPASPGTASNTNKSTLDSDPLGTKFDTAFPRTDEIDCVRKLDRCIYDAARQGLFNFLLIVGGIILSLWWGLVMGATQFAIIWVFRPYIKVVNLVLKPLTQCLGGILGSLITPMFGCFGGAAKKLKDDSDAGEPNPYDIV